MELAAELQEIGDAFSAAVDLEERTKLSHRAQAIFLEQQLTVWGWHSPWFNVVSPKVEGIVFELGGRIPLFHKAWLARRLLAPWIPPRRVSVYAPNKEGGTCAVISPSLILREGAG